MTNSGQPAPARVGEVERIIACAGPEGWVETRQRAMPPLPLGLRVRITDGAFEGHEAPVRWSDHLRVRLMLEIFGGSREVTVARSSVRAIPASESSRE